MLKKKYRVTINGKVYEVEVEVTEESSNILPSSKSINRKTPKLTLLKKHLGVSKERKIRAPMAGKVVKINVKKGDIISKGDVILMLESMKTLVEVKAEKDGIVKEILAREGKFVNKNDTILELE